MIRKAWILAVACFLTGCSDKVQELISSAPHSAVYVLVDISSSTDSERVRSQVRKDFDTVLASWKNTGGELRGDVIGSNALNESIVPIRATIPSYNSLTSEEKYHEKTFVKPALDKLHQQLEATLRTPASQRTAILSALSVAAKVLNGDEFRGAKHRALVIFSDMIEESDLYNFQHDTLSDSRITNILQKERSAGRIPQLTGVRIWKAGASSSDVPEAKTRQLEKFWLEYFKAAGADCPKEHYAPALLDFNLSW